MVSFELPCTSTVVGPLNQLRARIWSTNACLSASASAAGTGTLATANSATATQVDLNMFVSASGQRVQKFNKRRNGAVESLHLGIVGFDEVILIRSMGARPVSQAVVPCRQAQGRLRENAARPGSRRARPQLP